MRSELRSVRTGGAPVVVDLTDEVLVASLGSSQLEVQFDFGYWTVIEDVASNVTVHMRGDVQYRKDDGSGTIVHTDDGAVVCASLVHANDAAVVHVDVVVVRADRGIPGCLFNDGGTITSRTALTRVYGRLRTKHVAAHNWAYIRATEL